jgi:hypothetical protein
MYAAIEDSYEVVTALIYADANIHDTDAVR